MEKWLILGIIISICLLLEGCGAGNENSYTMAYQRFLDAYVEENEYAHMARAALTFIDDDNVPELLLIEDNGHASGVKVYTYYQEWVRAFPNFFRWRMERRSWSVQ